MILLRLISWPYLRKHVVRSLLMLVGVALGVAVFVAIHTANQAVLSALSQTIDRIGGTTQLQVTSGDAGIPEWALGKVRDAQGVRIAVPVIEAPVELGQRRGEKIFVRGVDLTADHNLRNYGLESTNDIMTGDSLESITKPDSLMITYEFAQHKGLALGDTLVMNGVEGPKHFVVGAIMKSGRLSRSFGGRLAIIDINVAQKIFGRGLTFDRIDLALNGEVSLDTGRAAVLAALGPGFDVIAPSNRGRQLDAVLVAYKTSVGVSSVFALFIGLFIIYNVFATAVTQRQTEIGVLRALGADSGQILRLFLAEGALTGLIGSVAGLVVGLILARSMATNISSMLEGVYGLSPQVSSEIQGDPQTLILAAVLGTLTSVLAAWIPARIAARVDPVQVLQKGGGQILSAGENLARFRWALAAAFLSALLFFGSSDRLAFYVGYALAITSALLLTPALSRWSTVTLRPFLKWLRPVEGTLAADSILQAPRRTSATVTAVMLSLAQVVALGGLGSASYESITNWVNETLNPDLFIVGSPNLTLSTFRFPGSMYEELVAVPGIAHVQGVRRTRINYRSTPALLISMELDDIARSAHRKPVAGHPDQMYASARRGDGAIVSENFAQLQQVGLGDKLELPTPNGMLVLPIVGIIVDWSDPLGTIFIDRQIYVRYWEDESVNLFNVYLSSGADERTVRERLISSLAGKHRLFVLTNREVRDYIMQQLDQWLGLTYMQLAVAVFIAILGIVNTLIVSILDRRRELGLLRAVGALAGQIRGTIWIEALIVATIGVFLGVILGAVNLHYLLDVAKFDISGFPLEYRFPWGIAALLLPIMLTSALVAALGPGESAVRGSLIEALEYE